MFNFLRSGKTRPSIPRSVLRNDVSASLPLKSYPAHDLALTCDEYQDKGNSARGVRSGYQVKQMSKRCKYTLCCNERSPSYSTPNTFCDNSLITCHFLPKLPESPYCCSCRTFLPHYHSAFPSHLLVLRIQTTKPSHEPLDTYSFFLPLHTQKP